MPGRLFPMSAPPSSPSDLVGDRHDDNVAMSSYLQFIDPMSQGGSLTVHMHVDAAGAVDKQASKVIVATFADA